MRLPIPDRVAALAAPLALLALASCSNAPTETVWGARFHSLVLDEYDLDADVAGGASTSDSTDYFAVQGGLYLRSQETTGRPLASAELAFGVAEYDDVEAVEVAAGARYYAFTSEHVRPFAGLYLRTTGFESIGGLNTGTQVGVAPALGVEIPLTDVFALDLLLDYTVPLAAAESGGNPAVDREVSGLAVRIGFSVDF